MGLLYRFYGWLIDRPGVVRRWVVFNALIIVSVALLVAKLDTVWGALEMRWGLTVWFSFVGGFGAVAVFNTVLGLLALGYPGRRS